MTNRRSLGALLAPLVITLAGCGEDGQSLRATQSCPDQPIYQYAFVGSGGTGTWQRFSPPQPGSGGHGPPLTADKELLVAAPNDCLTKAGTALPLDAGH